MSYSIGFVAQTKQAAKEQVTAEFDEIVRGQPVHVRDRELAQAAALAAIDALADDFKRDVSVSVYGSVSWDWSGAALEAENQALNGVNLTVGVNLIERK